MIRNLLRITNHPRELVYGFAIILLIVCGTVKAFAFWPPDLIPHTPTAEDFQDAFDEENFVNHEYDENGNRIRSV